MKLHNSGATPSASCFANTHAIQIDEGIAPAAHTDRSPPNLNESLRKQGTCRPEQLYAMPVGSNVLKAAADRYAEILQKRAGSPGVLDLVHLPTGRVRRDRALLLANQATAGSTNRVNSGRPVS